VKQQGRNYLGLACGCWLFACEPRIVDLLAEDTSPDTMLPSWGGAPGESAGNGSGGDSEPEEDPPNGDGGSAPGERSAMIVTQARDGAIDLTIERRLLDLGFVVEQIRQDTVTAPMTEDYSLVIISPTADGDALGGSLGQSPTPQLILEPNVAFVLGYGQRSTGIATDSISCIKPKTELTEGMPDTLLLCTSAVLKSGALLGAEITSGANLDSTAGVSIWYSLETDTMIKGSRVPGPRVVLGTLHDIPCQTEASFQLFDRSVAWLTKLK
jgi:hypothetical protein